MLALLFALVAAPQAKDYDVAPAALSLQPAGAETHTAENPRARATVDWVNVSGIKGDGRSAVDVFFFVIAPDGGCAADADIYLSADMGELGEVESHGCGLYSVPFTPPEVRLYTEVLVTVSGLTDARDAVWQQQGIWVEPKNSPMVGAGEVEEPVAQKRKGKRTTTSPVVSTAAQTASR